MTRTHTLTHTHTHTHSLLPACLQWSRPLVLTPPLVFQIPSASHRPHGPPHSFTHSLTRLACKACTAQNTAAWTRAPTPPLSSPPPHPPRPLMDRASHSRSQWSSTSRCDTVQRPNLSKQHIVVRSSERGARGSVPMLCGREA